MSENQVIAVLGGTGHEGAGLAMRWAKAGLTVVIGSRDAARAAEKAAEIAALTGGTVSGADNAAAAAAAAVVVLAVPYAGQAATAQSVAAELQGKILIDVTVPLVPPKVARVQLPEGGSAVEALQRRLGEGVKVVSAFQNVSAHQLADLAHDVDCDVLVTGDDEAARETVCDLARKAGMRASASGPSSSPPRAGARAGVLISINRRYKVAAGAGIRITGIPDQA